MTDTIVTQVVDKFHMRSEFGITKYKTTLKENNADDYLNHLQQELMDATLYIEKKMDIDKHIGFIISITPNDEDLGKIIRSIYKVK